MPDGSILGAAVKRAEDPRFIIGAGGFLSDLEADGAVWMVPVRSDVAHGVLGDVEITAALSSPGVVAVYLGNQLEMKPLPVGAPGLDDITRRDAIAFDRVRFVGDIVAVVVAETKQAAVDAAHLIWPEIEPLMAMTNTDAATADDAVLLFPDLGTNVIYDRGEPDQSVLGDAEVVISTTVVNQRLAAVPMEPNGAVATPREDGGLDIWVGSQSAAGHRRGLSAVLGLDPALVHVKVPDVGGGFGAKIGLYAEQALCGAIALDLGRQVRWEEDRRENLMAMSHGRAQVSEVRLGSTRQGAITGISIRVTQDAGAYPLFGAYLPEFSRRMAVGPYLIPKVEFLWRSVVTNTTPVHAYRGAGRPEATMALERAMDLLAAELEMDPAELRRRNFIAPGSFPHVTAVGERYDSGDYEKALDLALTTSGYDELRRQQAERRTRGDRLQMGIGVSSYVEITAAGGRDDWSAVEVHSDGTATAYSGAVSNGQGHETTFAQIVSEILRMPLEDIEFVQGDTDHVPHGGGTMASRSLQIAGSAVLTAGRRTLHKARAIYAFHREAALDDVVQLDDGRIGVVGVPGSGMTLAEIAEIAADFTNLPEDMEPGLRGEDTWEQDEATFPFGTHVSVVEVDTEIGDVRILLHVACDDAGIILNRLVVDGQVHGGVAQGIGQALLEEFIYDGNGPATGNLTTYLIPTATGFPTFTVAHTETPTDQNPLGAKGIGEAGTIGSTPAVVNAVIDALAPFGVTDLAMPLTPHRVWSAIRG
ncbi:MAG TPA: xanthine dehydrogenase family protein molybdopterin-binding subunit [Acidimicrobiia bacterium]|nr:xanthine dehydrogenase family protein molybdopterin-binding subunit [Acidimicrobiia bacterium]